MVFQGLSPESQPIKVSMMAKVYYHYTPLAPLQSEYKDDGSTILLSAPCEIKNTRIFEISLLGTQQEIQLIRVAIRTASEKEEITEEESNKIIELNQHMLSVLRVTYDPNADFANALGNFLKFGTFADEGKPSGMNLKLSITQNNEYKLNTQNILSTLCTSAISSRLRNVLSLISDANVASYPLQFRYLSLY